MSAPTAVFDVAEVNYTVRLLWSSGSYTDVGYTDVGREDLLDPFAEPGFRRVDPTGAGRTGRLRR